MNLRNYTNLRFTVLLNRALAGREEAGGGLTGVLVVLYFCVSCCLVCFLIIVLFLLLSCQCNFFYVAHALFLF